MTEQEHLTRLKQRVRGWNAWREKHRHIQAHFRGANLGEMKLRRANLREADLAASNLMGAKLFEADLRGAILSGANLHRADLSKAKLSKPDLSTECDRSGGIEGKGIGGEAKGGSRRLD